MAYQEDPLQDFSVSELTAAAKPYTDAFWVHPNDFLFKYILQVFGREEGLQGYFRGGQSDASQAHRALVRSHGQKTSLRILEFAAGYGRVSRHHKTIFSGHSYTAADIHPEACDFLSSKLDTNSVRSHMHPSSFNVESRFDFIFVLSLFSHLPDHTFGPWLGKLFSLLDCGGFLLFTTHGEFAVAKHPNFFNAMLVSSKGFDYTSNSDQPDLDNSEYGTMVVTMSYVIQSIQRFCPNAHIESFSSGPWFGLQDEWVIKKV